MICYLLSSSGSHGNPPLTQVMALALFEELLLFEGLLSPLVFQEYFSSVAIGWKQLLKEQCLGRFDQSRMEVRESRGGSLSQPCSCQAL